MSSYSYQPYYCEENVWRLCRQNPFDGNDVYAVVISNRTGACPLWNQREAPSSTRPVLWDYHVVAVERRAESTLVWDLDTRLECPAPVAVWWQATFPALERLGPAFQPNFRVVPRDIFLDTLSTDRSHMQTDGGEFKKPPPDWDRIFDPKVGMNLDRFVDMDDEFVGRVVGAESPDAEARNADSPTR
ncbi:MAG: hypothetical protein ABEN55_17880 [Bradymonadaceae bacterium]